LIDTATGRPVLMLVGTSAIANERGLPTHFAGPAGVLSAAVGAHEFTVFRARVPGMTVRGIKVATVSRPNGAHPDVLKVAAHEPAFQGMTFARTMTSADLPGYANGLSDPPAGVWDLVAADGQLVARHWASVGRDFMLAASDFDVYDASVPLPELICVLLARYIVWCPVRDRFGNWNWTQ
jgi:hypothetical protein